MDVLMHMCCANCSLYPAKALRAEGLRMLGYWYNPNIQPEGEYALRLGAVKQLSGLRGMEMYYDEPELFDRALLDSAGPLRPERCKACYTLRLGRTAAKARKLGVGAFTTSLLVSPYQAHELIVQAAREAAEEHGVDFLYRDFRTGWREGQAESRELSLYRQYYCGCLNSKNERDSERQLKRHTRPSCQPEVSQSKC